VCAFDFQALTFYYLGLTERLKAMLEDRELHPLLQLQHPTPRDQPFPLNGTVRSVWESRGWYEHVTLGRGRTSERDPELEPLDPPFGTHSHDLVLSLCVDGFTPWRRSEHTIWPIMFMVLNLPANLRHRAEYLLLAGVIPGPKKTKNIQAYMKVVVDELLVLWRQGIEYTPPGCDAPDIARVKLLFTCCDYPAHGELNAQQTSGFNGCIKCEIKVREQ
jgi:hypothetical protein